MADTDSLLRLRTCSIRSCSSSRSGSACCLSYILPFKRSSNPNAVIARSTSAAATPRSRPSSIARATPISSSRVTWSIRFRAISLCACLPLHRSW